ncbi:hypothetical protein O181_061267 [Austropuccinia psidii MF-1]|uniref:Uncharacterized protein n=1 Tax=Austropuccinia psidii MF-1 TaxID=1389203 RepID=A0A9Q3EQ43_9BASI|nr:hypothetical protein [Austropuccinia psidii MF-1]
MPTLTHELAYEPPHRLHQLPMLMHRQKYACTPTTASPPSPILALLQPCLIISAYYNSYAPAFFSRFPSAPGTSSLPSPILVLPLCSL